MDGLRKILSKEEMDRRLAGGEIMNAKAYDKRRKTSTGRSIYTAMKEQYEKDEFEKLMDIDMTILTRSIDLPDKIFIVVNMQQLCITKGIPARMKNAGQGKGILIPSEIAMTAFTLQKGIIDNFCAIIDPGEIPVGCSLEIRQSSRRNYVPPPPFSESHQDFYQLTKSMDKFLAKHKNKRTKIDRDDDSDIIYCFRNEIMKTFRAFKFIYKQTGVKKPFRIFSLERLLMEISKEGAFELFRHEGIFGNPYRTITNIPEANVIDFIFHRKAVMRDVYSKQNFIVIPPSFVDELSAANFLETYNTASIEELACPFHMKIREAVEHCALYMANLQTFGLLDFVLPNFGILPIIGRHLPSDDLEYEKVNRIRILKKSGYIDLHPPKDSDENTDSNANTDSNTYTVSNANTDLNANKDLNENTGLIAASTDSFAITNCS